MLRSLVCTSVLCAVFMSGLVVPPRAYACPVEIPETLLSLYRNSKEVHIARFDKTVQMGIQSEEDNYTILDVKHHFDISSTLKGTSRKMFAYEDTEYQFKQTGEETAPEEPEETDAAPAEETIVGEPEEAAEAPDEEVADEGLKAGDAVILFLTEEEKEEEGEDGDKPAVFANKEKAEPKMVLTRDGYGVKRVDPADLTVLEARINELNGIFKGDKADPAAVVDWLIRCMEHPATRWDGAYELSRSFAVMESEIEEARERAEKGETESDQDESGVVRRFESFGGGTNDPAYARATTDTHKHRITNILVSPDDGPQDEKKPDLSSGDRAMIDLVTHWADRRVAAFLLDRMQNPREDPWSISSLMDTVVKVLANEEVTSAAEKYANVLGGDDAEEVEEANETESEERVSEDETRPAADGEPSKDAAEAPPVKKITYGEMRSTLLANFIAAANAALSRGEVAQTAQK